jgi:hypothetical protein
VRSRRDTEQATELQSVRYLLHEARERIRNVEHEHLEEHLKSALREIDQRVCDFESPPKPLSVSNEIERDGNGASSSSSFTRWGALGAMLAGLAWTVSGIIGAFLAPAGGRGPEMLGFVPLDEALYGVALVGTLGGLVGLHARQAPSYGRLGSVGFLASFLGVSLLLVGLSLSFLAGRFLDQVMGLGFLVTLVGFILLGAATLRLGVLPWWCALLLIACLPLAIDLGHHGGAFALGLIWLALGCMLLLSCYLSALFQTFEKSEGVSKPVRR